MANDQNEIKLEGRLGRDPEYRKTKGGHDVCRISLATNKKYKTLAGEWKQQTVWHTVELYGDKALRALHRYNKGDRVRVAGESVPFSKMINQVRVTYHLVKAHFIRKINKPRKYTETRYQAPSREMHHEQEQERVVPFDVNDFL